ncbi:MAG: lipoprotein-releasing ABC transporter permease subunit [Nitrospirae bacterium]|nr:MAG: lipoprotein-releasing ABC transporter permease subunit [Nitrospirota bacterium]
MPPDLFIALRYLRSRRKSRFISLITWFSVGGIALGVAALLTVIAVMTGFEEDLRDKILATNAHLVVLSHDPAGIADPQAALEAIRRDPAVAGASPFVLTQVMLTTPRGVSGVVLHGVDPETLGQVSHLPLDMKEGSVAALARPAAPGPEGGPPRPPLLIGRELSRTLGAWVGDEVHVVSPQGEPSPMGGILPKIRTFRVAGIFETGMYEYDSSMAYCGLKEAQAFLGMGGAVTGIAVKTRDFFHAREVAARLQRALGYPFWARDWIDMNRNLFSALKLEKVTMFLILTLIILVAAFNIISSLVMMVMEKGREIAILRATGATRRFVRRVFLWQGALIGLSGTFIGLAVGLTLCAVLDRWHFIQLPGDVYYFTTLPVRVRATDFALVTLAAAALSLLATLFPAWQAGRLEPVEALRYE